MRVSQRRAMGACSATQTRAGLSRKAHALQKLSQYASLSPTNYEHYALQCTPAKTYTQVTFQNQ